MRVFAMESRAIFLTCIVSMLAAAVLIGLTPAPVVQASVPVPAGTPVSSLSLRSDAPGVLVVTSVPPGAEVWLDSDPGPSAATPATLTLSPITHPVMVRLAGYRDFVTSVRIEPDADITLAATLVPAD